MLQRTGCDSDYGGTCNFTCPIGYRLIGNATLTCLSTNGGPPGEWDRAMPRCEGRFLSDPSYIYCVTQGMQGINITLLVEAKELALTEAQKPHYLVSGHSK